jgi:hypothetical protein
MHDLDFRSAAFDGIGVLGILLGIGQGSEAKEAQGEGKKLHG